MDWSTETRNSLLGGEQGRCPGTCVPRSAVCPRVPPAGLPHSTKSWWPLGTQPGWCRRVHSQCVITVILCEPPCLAVWCVGRGTALLGSRTGSGYPREEPHQVIPASGGLPPLTLGPGLRCAVQDGGSARASHMSSVCLLPALHAPSPQGAQLLGLCWWNEATTGAQMPLWAVPIPVGDVMPRRRGGPSEALASWSWHPSLAWGSQPEVGGGIASAQGEVEAQPGPATGMESLCGPHPRPGSLLLPGPSRAVLTATSTPLLRASQWRLQGGQPLTSAWRNVGVLVRGCRCTAPARAAAWGWGDGLQHPVLRPGLKPEDRPWGQVGCGRDTVASVPWALSCPSQQPA